MTLATWKEEFYPIEAEKVSAEDALEHSLRKWIGLRKENLDRHGVKPYFRRIRCSLTGAYLTIDDSSCALCERFKVHRTNLKIDCTKCPLYEANGSYRCDESKSEDSYSQFGHWQINDDPEPMIALLEKAVASKSRKKVESMYLKLIIDAIDSKQIDSCKIERAEAINRYLIMTFFVKIGGKDYAQRLTFDMSLDKDLEPRIRREVEFLLIRIKEQKKNS